MPFPFNPFRVFFPKRPQHKESAERTPLPGVLRDTTQKTIGARPSPWTRPATTGSVPNPTPRNRETDPPLDVRRNFYNESRFQCYASFFAHWGGWITAGHCLTETHDLRPPFADGTLITWPEGLDAALIGCSQFPKNKPRAPQIGQRIIAYGYPAGARHIEQRIGHVYIERGAGSGQWIAHIETPDEPVVTGMSGGPVVDANSGQPIGVIITRNSPADLNNDRDPDESYDFIALSEIWTAVTRSQTVA